MKIPRREDVIFTFWLSNTVKKDAKLRKTQYFQLLIHYTDLVYRTLSHHCVL